MQIFFDTFDEFVESIKYAFMPDIISLLRGQYEQDVWASLKLFVLIAICAGLAYGVFIGTS